MKTYRNSVIQSSLTMLFLTLSMVVFSQKSITWKGGTPGMENDWNCHKNWSTFCVPDEFSDVIIPDVSTTSLATPVLYSGKVEINSLLVEPSTTLRIEKNAQLIVYGNVEGVIGGNIQVVGKLYIIDEEAVETGLKAMAKVKN